MQADSSAKRTCSESRSTSLCTATVRMPISLQVQIILHAISPRLAIRILRNGLVTIIEVSGEPVAVSGCSKELAWHSAHCLQSNCSLRLDSEKRLAVFNGLCVLNVNLYDFAGRLCLD